MMFGMKELTCSPFILSTEWDKGSVYFRKLPLHRLHHSRLKLDTWLAPVFTWF